MKKPILYQISEKKISPRLGLEPAKFSDVENVMAKLLTQIREQILVPDLYVFTVESVAYKKKG